MERNFYELVLDDAGSVIIEIGDDRVYLITARYENDGSRSKVEVVLSPLEARRLSAELHVVAFRAESHGSQG